MLAASLMLSGCTLVQWQQEEAKTKADFQRLRTEQRERDYYTACVAQGALPGSAENLACQLELAKKDQQPDPAPKP